MKLPRKRLSTEFIRYIEADIKKTNVTVYNPATNADILFKLSLILLTYYYLSSLRYSGSLFFLISRIIMDAKNRPITVIISIMTNILTPVIILFLFS